MKTKTDIILGIFFILLILFSSVISIYFNIKLNQILHRTLKVQSQTLSIQKKRDFYKELMNEGTMYFEFGPLTKGYKW